MTTSSPCQDHATPLAFATTGATYDADDGDDDIIRRRDLLSRRRRLRRLCLICGGLCCAVLVLVALVILVLALTVFKVKDPVVTMNSVTISDLALSSALLAPISINVTALANISVRNPNAASFVFGATATTVYYRGRVLAVAYSPAGAAPAHGSFSIDVTVKVRVDDVLGDSALVGDVAAGSIAVTTKTKVGGRVKVLGFIRHHVDVRLECSMTVALASQAITDQSCSEKVSL